MTTKAQAYVDAVSELLPLIAETQWQLREWWRLEAGRRREYGLTEEHEAELSELCRTWLAMLPPGEAPAPASTARATGAPRPGGAWRQDRPRAQAKRPAQKARFSYR